jgi:hypothetical protein
MPRGMSILLVTCTTLAVGRVRSYMRGQLRDGAITRWARSGESVVAVGSRAGRGG